VSVWIGKGMERVEGMCSKVQQHRLRSSAVGKESSKCCLILLSPR